LGKRMFAVGFEPWGDPPPFGVPVFAFITKRESPCPCRAVRLTPS
jgi:hypothetical protein